MSRKGVAYEMETRILMLRIAAGLGGLGVVLGAFAAHGLKEKLAPEMLSVFEVGVRYQMYHALALLAISVASASLWTSRMTTVCAWSWIGGTLVFSGSLYLLAVTEMRWLGAITPIGGVLFIVGWVSLIMAAGAVSRQP